MKIRRTEWTLNIGHTTYILIFSRLSVQHRVHECERQKRKKRKKIQNKNPKKYELELNDLWNLEISSIPDVDAWFLCNLILLNVSIRSKFTIYLGHWQLLWARFSFFFMVHSWITIIIFSVCTKRFAWMWNHRKKSSFFTDHLIVKKRIKLKNCDPKSVFIIPIPVYPVPSENWQPKWMYQGKTILTRFER